MKSSQVFLFFSILAVLALSAAGREIALDTGNGGELERHHVGVFMGGASRFEKDVEDETGFAIGLEYEWRFSRRFGVGGCIEGVPTAGVRDYLIAFPITWHPIGDLKVSAAAGVEFHDHDEEFLVRIAAGYDFRIGRFTVGPDVSIDFTHNSRTLVYGVLAGWEF